MLNPFSKIKDISGSHTSPSRRCCAGWLVFISYYEFRNSDFLYRPLLDPVKNTMLSADYGFQIIRFLRTLSPEFHNRKIRRSIHIRHFISDTLIPNKFQTLNPARRPSSDPPVFYFLFRDRKSLLPILMSHDQFADPVIRQSGNSLFHHKVHQECTKGTKDFLSISRRNRCASA